VPLDFSALLDFFELLEPFVPPVDSDDSSLVPLPVISSSPLWRGEAGVIPPFVPRVDFEAVAGEALALGAAVAEAYAPGDALFVGPSAGGGGLLPSFVAAVAPVRDCVVAPVVVAAPVVAFVFATPTPPPVTPKLE